ncbi:MAG: hypothetical protein N3A66_09680, partial [Planctomycetota bacterium]|nr:hypothetical protein [Planctomycetota bacterium]
IYTGLAALGKSLYYADTANNALRIATADAPEPTQAISLPAPTSPCGDASANVMWAISGGAKIVAISPDGKVRGESQEVPEPICLTARHGCLAVASARTGKIHIFDSRDPAALKPLRALGRGDGPDGQVLSDRFWFQNNTMRVCLALGPQRQLAVAEEEGRLQVFDQAGDLLWSSFSTEGGSGIPSRLFPGRLYGNYFIYQTDSAKGTWRLESFYRHLRQGGRILGDCRIQGEDFLAFLDVQSEEAAPDGQSPVRWGRLGFVKLADGKAAPAGAMVWKWSTADPWTFRYDDNGDGRIDYRDGIVYTLTDSQGKPASLAMSDPRWTALAPNGELTFAAVPGGWLIRWPCAGLDERGAPRYRFADQLLLRGEKDAIVSPYDNRPSGAACGDHVARGQDGWVCLGRASGAPWQVMINNGGTDLVGLDKQGQVDWFLPCGHINVIGSLKGGNDIYLAALADSYDCLAVNGDGLAMAGLCPAERADY